jgi:tetratricopeptide (TPR) repeat protein
MIGFLLATALQHLRSASGSIIRRSVRSLGLVLLLGSTLGASEIVPPDTLSIQLQELLLEARRNPRSAAVYVEIAEVYRLRGNLVAARASAEEALRRGLAGRDSIHAALVLVEIALQQGRTHEGHRRLARLVEQGRGSPDAMARLAQLRWADHFRTEGLALGMEAVSRDPDDAEKKRWLAARWKEAGRPDVARGLWASLVTAGRATDEDLFQVGYLSQRLDDDARAFDVYRVLLERNPRHTEANYNLSQLLAAVGDTLGALRHLEQAVRSAPEFQTAYVDLALLYLRSGREDDARRVLVDFLARARPDSVTDAQVRAVLRSLAGKPPRP